MYLYWYSLALKKSVEEETKMKNQLLVNKLELEKTQLKNARLEVEQIVKQEKTLRLEREMLLKNKELTSTTLLASKHNEVLSKINKRLSDIKTPGNNRKVFSELQSLIRNNISIENEWSQFKVHFEKVHPDFFKGLKEKHPRLTQTDLRHCAYIKMRMSTKEIARMFNINATSVQTSRVRMKKKMKLDKATDLWQYILGF